MNLTEKLRAYAAYMEDSTLVCEAAREIERLQGECERLTDELSDARFEERACRARLEER